ncbi:hypothetical protein RND71_018944 [Anisodus tanguticus]|uniref:Uncharacterized protein n=1 Tax=Anisodus tanguticus TaxID=243964 RepID=A0AAE1S504_9SOLA|nr:hypothetical protein RND71_018944 [Anisodus tanguticus]
MGAISALNQQLQSLQAELNATRAEILRYNYREATNSLIASNTHAALVSTAAAGGSTVAVAELPQAPSTPTYPPRPLPPQESLAVVVSYCSSPSLAQSLTADVMEVVGNERQLCGNPETLGFSIR